MLPELTTLAQDNEDFSGSSNALNGAYALSGTIWTMGALFGQSSGLPLKIDIDGNSMGTQSNFFPSISTLGDILSNNGYNNTFLLGSDANFGARSSYYNEHGNYTIKDYVYAKENDWIDDDYSVWWGYEDEKLFSFTKETLKELSSSDEPFNLTMLTVDTHFEDGYVCGLCEGDYDTQYSNVFRCSSKQVTSFVKWVQQQDFYDNTTIVISGDHPTMDGDYCANVDASYQRRTYTCYINSATNIERSDTRVYSTFDNFPTTLEALGVDIPGGKLGLGTSLYSSEDTLIEEYGVDYVNEELNKHSDFMDNLADLDYEGLARMTTFGITQYEPRKYVISVAAKIGIEDIYAVLYDENGTELGTVPIDWAEDGNYYMTIENEDAKTYQISVTVSKTGHSYLLETIYDIE